MKCIFTEMVSSVGLHGCSCTTTNFGFLSSSFRAVAGRVLCIIKCILHFYQDSLFYPVLGTSCIKLNFYKHLSSALIELCALSCVCISTVLLHVVSAPVGAIATGISQHLFPLISRLVKEVNEGL